MKKQIKGKPISESRAAFLARERAMQLNLCIWCRVVPPMKGRTRCEDCIEKDRVRKCLGRPKSPRGRGRPPIDRSKKPSNLF